MLCDTNCTVFFTKPSVTMLDPQDNSILAGWRKCTFPKLWCFSLRPQHQPVAPTGSAMSSLNTFSAYYLPMFEALVCYLHTVTCSPVHYTWIAAIKSGNYSSWPGINYQTASQYCPATTKTLCGHEAKPASPALHHAPMHKAQAGSRTAHSSKISLRVTCQ